jgi:hypothetical protein
MIKFTFTNKMLKEMVFEITRHRSRVLAVVALVYGFVGAPLFISELRADIRAWLVAAIVSSSTLFLVMFVLTYVVTFKRTKDVSKVATTSDVTWKFTESGLETKAGKVFSNIPYEFIKSSWQTKKYLYVTLRGSGVLGCPKANISDKDWHALAEHLGIQPK